MSGSTQVQRFVSECAPLPAETQTKLQTFFFRAAQKNKVDRVVASVDDQGNALDDPRRISVQQTSNKPTPDLQINNQQCDAEHVAATSWPICFGFFFAGRSFGPALDTHLNWTQPSVLEEAGSMKTSATSTKLHQFKEQLRRCRSSFTTNKTVARR